MIGSSPAELESAAHQLDDAAAWVDQSSRELAGTLGALSWAGAAALRFGDTWSSRHKPALVSTSAFLREQAGRLRAQARQQRTASEQPIGAHLADGITGPGAGSNPTRPPYGTQPDGNAKWWASLGETGQRWVMANHPDWVRNMDGVPADVRDRLNRAALMDEYARIKGELAEINDRRNLLHDMTSNDDRRAELLKQKLEAIDQIAVALGHDRDHHLLLFDAESSNKVLAAVASGDVYNAKHVAVMVPGMGTTVEGGIVAKVNDADSIRADCMASSGETVAVVTWMGYEAPAEFPFVGSVDDLNKARAGAPSLESFLAGIDQRPVDVNLTVLAHSYGSTTAGIALSHMPGGIVDNVVFYGSPGLADGSSHLAVPPGHAYVLEAAGDPVADVGRFGGDPDNNPMLTRLSAEGADTNPLWTHSEYLHEGSVSRSNIENVVTGQVGNLVVERWASTPGTPGLADY